MNWQGYKLVYRAMSPVHIGYRTLGFVQRTRYYIPGRVLWGAVTANLTRAYFSYEDYKEVGDQVSANVRFSYFYPAVKADDPLLPMLPKFTSQGLKYGDMSVEDFEAKFIRSYGQTAVEPQSVAAEDGSLHETEFICQNTVEKDSKPVVFIGYIFLKDGAKIPTKQDSRTLCWDTGDCPLKPAVAELFAGGERKYGFGRLVMDSRTEPLNNDDAMFECNLIAGDEVQIKIQKGKALPAHLLLGDNSAKLKGDVEPLVGRDLGAVKGWAKDGKAALYWVPGSIVTENTPLRIDRHGILTYGGV